MSDINELQKAREIINDVDKQIAVLFEKRMNLVKDVALYKKEHSLPILDINRESELLNKNLDYIKDSNLIEYYKKYLQQLMDISKEYQKEVIEMEK